MQIKLEINAIFCVVLFIAPPSGGSLGMAEVNQLIQQAFVMGQQSVLQPSG